MLSVLSRARKSVGRAAVALMALAVAACDTVGGPAGPAVDPSGTVQVALLVPGGSGQASDELLATSLQNAARLAIADLAGVSIDLRVYNTAGQAAQAQAMAVQAMDEGAKIILGPVYAQEANAVGSVAAGRGVNVLTFSNNIDVAGGNVFVLGNTFDNTARRLARYAVTTGSNRIMVVHDRNAAGEAGRAAIERGVTASGGTLVATGSYEFSQNGIVQAVPGIASSARSAQANALFLTAETAGALPILTQLLRENGLDAASTRFIGITRWDIPAGALSLPGLQGGLFALPDPGLYGLFQNRYQGAYGQPPHPIASLGYDGIAAIGALLKRGSSDALTASALTQGSGFAGVTGVFRFLPDGTNERQLAVAQIRGGQAVVIDAAPRSFGGFGL
jgi:ABC-type branched-subunit amino acid transport system substrate-binding protein